MSWKVVIVEDEDLLRNGLIEAIPWEKLGYTVVGEADNGKKGLNLIKELSPHLVFSDIRMAQMDGLTMAEKICEWNPNIRIVFISGYDEFDYAMRALRVGAVEFILKPIRLEQVEETLRRLAESLEEEENQKQEYSELKRLEEYGKGQARRELYRSIIYGTSQEGSRREHFEQMLKGELNEFFGVIIVERKDFAALTVNVDYMELMKMDHSFERMLQVTVGDEIPYTMIRGSACERILVFQGTDILQVKGLTEQAGCYLMDTEENKGKFQLGKGNIHRYAAGLCASYQNARRDLEEQYRQEWDKIMEVQCDVGGKMNFINYDKESLFQAIKSGDEKLIEREYSRLEELLHDQRVVSHMHLILVVTSIFEGLVKLLGEKGQFMEKAMGNPMEDYHRIISCGKRSEILNGLKDYCLALGECVGQLGETRGQESLKRAVAYMNREYGNDKLMMGDVAKHAYISSSYLGLLMKKEMGKTFIEYLTDIRMEHAKKLLSETTMKNYEIAQACGFANATYFSTVFKSVYGQSPSVYRREQEENS